jgi:steroid delta-isomerase-like uncharacterized protein
MAVSDEDRIRRQRETVAEHIGAENAHDWPGVYDTFVQDENAYYDVVSLSTHFGGIQGVKDFYAVIDAAFPDFQVAVNREYDMPGSSVREVTVTGTHKAEYCGLPASGNRINIEVAAFYLFSKEDPSKLVAERIYFDNDTILRQIRGEENAPTGIGLASTTG